VSAVSAIIVNWNGKHLLPECLDSLREQTYPADEILVVDNGSRDGSQDLIRERYPEVTLIELGENKGFSIANNIGIRRATGDYIALLNNDLVLDKHWVEHMVSTLEADVSLGSCACKMLFYDRRNTIDAAGIEVLTSGGGANRGLFEDASVFAHPARVFGACAGAALYRASMFQDVGLFDEDFYIYYEDVDLAFRAQLAGYDCLYVPWAIVYHHHSASNGRFGKKHYYLARNCLLVVVKNMPAPLLRRHLLRIVLGQLPFALDAAKSGNVGDYLDARLDALRLLPHMLRKRRAIQHGARRKPEEIAARLS
jgi:GT2 family glycosyltransferase